MVVLTPDMPSAAAFIVAAGSAAREHEKLARPEPEAVSRLEGGKARRALDKLAEAASFTRSPARTKPAKSSERFKPLFPRQCVGDGDDPLLSAGAGRSQTSPSAARSKAAARA